MTSSPIRSVRLIWVQQVRELLQLLLEYLGSGRVAAPR